MAYISSCAPTLNHILAVVSSKIRMKLVTHRARYRQLNVIHSSTALMITNKFVVRSELVKTDIQTDRTQAFKWGTIQQTARSPPEKVDWLTT